MHTGTVLTRVLSRHITPHSDLVHAYTVLIFSGSARAPRDRTRVQDHRIRNFPEPVAFQPAENRIRQTAP